MKGAASFTWDGLQALAQAVRDEHMPAAELVTSADVLAGLYSFKDRTSERAGERVIAPEGLTPQCPARP
jgi:hypothetical protein